MADGLDDKELGKRLSAGRGYARESVTEFAERIRVGRADLTQWELGNFGSKARPRSTGDKRREAVRKVHEASGLPASFFRVDLRKLDAIVESWEQPEPPEPGPPSGLIPPGDR